MAKQLINYNGRYCESDFENAFISFLDDEGWDYTPGANICRDSMKEVVNQDDLRSYLNRKYPVLTANDIQSIVEKVVYIGGDSDFATLHNLYKLIVNPFNIKSESGTNVEISLFDFADYTANTFRVVNQLVVEYVDHGNIHDRRPDVLLYVNGIPVCIIELKNPADANATIEDAHKQITIRYWRDIPHLLHYCPLACISDGVKTQLGTVKAPYEHYYSWRRIDNDSKIAQNSLDELQCMIKGVYRPERFMEIFRDYILFEDDNFNSDEREIICRYPQFFASRLLRESIHQAYQAGDNKGGTYFGATGCGKTYTMAFLARQLSMRCGSWLGSPTVIMIVDRDDLQKQTFKKVFGKCSEFLGLGEVKRVKNRKELKEELSSRESGGFYICTIQKFCDRKDKDGNLDTIGLLSNRNNIICFSDEAHRTQLENAKKIKFSKDENENMKAVVSKPYAKVLREAFPKAIFVGFTGTPIDETYATFGSKIDQYTMAEAVADGLTVPIKYHPRIARVLLDGDKVKKIEEYYKKCADEGATEDDIKASKEAMSSMQVILGEDDRLSKLATDIHDHFTKAIETDPTRVQKAMIVSSSREIAYKLLNQFKAKYPEWFKEQRTSGNDAEFEKTNKEAFEKLSPMPTIAMVATVGKDDDKTMYNYLGGTDNHKRNETLDAMFKDENSNLRICIVVDMWITGFDVECLTYLYNDKPLQKHGLIQTISRVNRKYPGKTYGLIIDYIGIRTNMLQAMKHYGGTSGDGDSAPEPTPDDITLALTEFRENLALIKSLFAGKYDLAPFIDPNTSDAQRYILLAQAGDYVFNSLETFNIPDSSGKKMKQVSFKGYFLNLVRRMRAAYDICQPTGELTNEESALAQSFMAIAGFVRKLSGTSDIDATSMNRAVEKMVEEALRYNNVESVLEEGDEVDIFGPEFIDRLKNVKMPATKLEMLVKMLKKKIKEYGKTNKIAAQKFEEMLRKTIEDYHNRRKKLSEEEAGQTQEQASEDIINNATAQALNLLSQMQADRESFRQVGLTFEEKAFYDILINQRNEHNFVYGEGRKVGNVLVNDKIKMLAKKIKEIIDTKSTFADWLNNQNVRNQLKFDIKICLVKNGYPPQYSPEVYKKVMEQVENYKERSNEGEGASAKVIKFATEADFSFHQAAEPGVEFGK